MKKLVLQVLISFIAISINGQVNLDSVLIGYWPFNGNMNDESNLNNHGNNNDCLLTTDYEGTTDRAYEFNGQTSFAEIPYSYEELTLPFSISAWVQKTELGAHEHIFSSSSQLDGYYGIYLSVNPEGLVQISYTDGGPLGSNSRRTKVTNSAIPLNEWVHIVVIVNGPDDMIIQFNSTIQEGEYSGAGGELLNGENNALIGRAAHNSNYWSGMIDEVRLYNRALSNEELNIICDSKMTSSVSQPKINATFNIYPNPSKDFININEVNKFSKYLVIDIQGGIVQMGQIRSNNYKIDVSNLNKGSYILKLIGKDLEVQQMFVVSY